MATIPHAQSGADDAVHRPYDVTVSRKIDAVLIALDEQPTPLRHAVLKAKKFWYERSVPAFNVEVQ